MLRLLANNLADTGVLTSRSESVDFPLVNIQHPFRSKPWRSSGIASEWLKWDLATNQAVDCVALLNTNCDANSTINFQANSLDDFIAPPVDLTIPFAAKIMILFFTPATYRWFRLLVTNTAGSYIEIGRVVFGKYFEPAKNYNQGWSHTLADPSKTNRTPAGQKHVDKKSKFNVVSLPFSKISDTEKYTSYLTLIDSLGIDVDFILSLDPANHLTDLSFYGRFQTSPPFTNAIDAGSRRHDFTLQFEESL